MELLEVELFCARHEHVGGEGRQAARLRAVGNGTGLHVTGEINGWAGQVGVSEQGCAVLPNRAQDIAGVGHGAVHRASWGLVAR